LVRRRRFRPVSSPEVLEIEVSEFFFLEGVTAGACPTCSKRLFRARFALEGRGVLGTGHGPFGPRPLLEQVVELPGFLQWARLPPSGGRHRCRARGGGEPPPKRGGDPGGHVRVCARRRRADFQRAPAAGRWGSGRTSRGQDSFVDRPLWDAVEIRPLIECSFFAFLFSGRRAGRTRFWPVLWDRAFLIGMLAASGKPSIAFGQRKNPGTFLTSSGRAPLPFCQKQAAFGMDVGTGRSSGRDHWAGGRRGGPGGAAIPARRDAGDFGRRRGFPPGFRAPSWRAAG